MKVPQISYELSEATVIIIRFKRQWCVCSSFHCPFDELLYFSQVQFPHPDDETCFIISGRPIKKLFKNANWGEKGL